MTAADRPAAPRRILLLVGAVGTGKGTQADLLSERLGLVHLASGNLFREALRDGTPLGKRAETYMARGDLVPDEVTIEMFIDRLSQPDASHGAILDGFPRTVAQAEALDATLATRGEAIDRVVFIDVPTEVLVERVAGRLVCPVCGQTYHRRDDPPKASDVCDGDGAELIQRDDDREEVVRARIAKQVPPMQEVLAHYERAGVVRRVNGDQPIEAVTRDVLEALA